MATAYENRVPLWFWIVSGMALLWEAIGCFAYVTQVSMTVEQLAALPEGQRALWESMPVWVTAAYAVAVWFGLTGAVALLMRRRWALPLFVVSLAACLVQFGWVFLIGGAAEKVGSSAYGLPATIIVIAAILVWFASMTARKGLLR